MEIINDIICISGLNADSNSYIIDDVLIDTGTGQYKDYLPLQIKKAGIDINDIKTILNTHCHFDHVGGNYLFPKAKVAMHEIDAEAMENDSHLTVSSMFASEIIRKDVDIKLKEGDKIKNFEVLHTPGHSHGSICLYDGNTLISGDTVFENGFGRVDIGGNMDDMIKSLQRLKNLDVEYLLPGHGFWTSKGNDSIQLANQLLGLY